MPRYFFDIHRSGNKLNDKDGSDFADDQMAESEAIGILQDMSRSMALDDDGQDAIHVDVRNAAGHVIFRAKLELTTERIAP